MTALEQWIDGIAGSKGYSFAQKPPRHALSQSFYTPVDYFLDRVIHSALDIRGRTGTVLRAFRGGQVIVSKLDTTGWGNTVVLRTNFGGTHRFAHMDARWVKVGDTIQRGQSLGTLGNTGHSTAEHLHWEVKNAAGRLVDPFKVYPEPAYPTPSPMSEHFVDIPASTERATRWDRAFILGWMNGVLRADGKRYAEPDRAVTRDEILLLAFRWGIDKAAGGWNEETTAGPAPHETAGVQSAVMEQKVQDLIQAFRSAGVGVPVEDEDTIRGIVLRNA